MLRQASADVASSASSAGGDRRGSGADDSAVSVASSELQLAKQRAWVRDRQIKIDTARRAHKDAVDELASGFRDVAAQIADARMSVLFTPEAPDAEDPGLLEQYGDIQVPRG